MRSHGFAAALLLASVAIVPTACSRERGDADRGDAASPADPAEWARLSGFTKVEATGPDTVIIRRGPYSVRAEGDAKVLERLKIGVDGDTLEIGRKRQYGMSWSNDRGATVTVTMPAIRSVDSTGSGDVSIDRADGDSFKADLTGSGDLSIADLNVADLEAEITGSGDIKIAGSAQKVDLSVTGSGNFDGAALKAGGGEASVLGSGNITFASDGALDISILGSGDVTVKGRAQCKTSSMGSGEARCAP